MDLAAQTPLAHCFPKHLRTPTVPAWKANADLMERLTSAQNHPSNSGRDIVTFAGFCGSRAELLEHVEHNERLIALSHVGS